MTGTKRLVAGVAATALATAMLAAQAQAQQITGGVSGKITDPNGHALAGAQVTIDYVPTHTITKTKTGADGFYNVQQLSPGGAYDVTASETGFAEKTVEIPSITVGDAYELNVTLDPGSSVTQVVVTAKRAGGNAQVQTGPRSTFTAADIQALPSFSRDLKDTARLNPFVTIDPTNSDGLIIAGNNNRVSTIYVDGVRQNDQFGLNGNGYPTQRSPFSIDIVKQFNVEVAPYDVQYGDFQGGVLNIVTKGGTNQFHGSGFFEYDSSDLGSGKEIGRSATRNPSCTSGAFTGTNAGGVACGGRYINPNFKDKNFGGTFGGPIIPDRLFFFISYEKYETTKIAGYVPSDAQGANPVTGVTQADVANVTSVLKANYGYDPLGYGSAIPVQNQDYFARIDANLTDSQRLFVTYQRTDGTTLNTPDESVTRTLGLGSTYYIYEQLLQSETADLQSHWTPKLSTELEYTHTTVDSPSTLLTSPQAFFQITLPSGTSIDAGPDISRQANNLSTSDQQVKAKVNYTIGNNVITAGYEFDDGSNSDLFVQNATGDYVFSSACGTGNALTNLAAHQACSFIYANAYDNNPETAGSTVTDYTHTLYLQDEWHPISSLRLRAGARVDYFITNDKPLYNPTFQSEYGFPNNETINGEYVVQPRLGFNWNPDPTLTIYGGAGLFSGGSPGVYVYDSYDNPGNLIGTVNCTNPAPKAGQNAACPAILSSVTGNSIPLAAQQAVTANANAGLGITNSLDPHFHPPANWKASVGVNKTFDFGRYGGSDWLFHIDYLFQKTQYAPNWVDLFEEANVLPTPAPDGRPVFNPARVTAARTTGYDIELTDTDRGHSNIVAVGLGKTLASIGLNFDYTFIYQSVKDITPATSSVALSNYSQSATADPNHPSLATSSYEVPWENKLSINYKHKFFGDNFTSFSLFMQYRSGLPYSYTFYSNATGTSTPYDNLFGQTGAAAYRNDQLLYVPKTDSSGNVTATSDPIVTYGGTLNTPAAISALNTYLHQTGLIKYAGSIAPRNGFFGAAVTTADISIQQQIPAFVPRNGKLTAYLDLINVPNLLNKDWGVIYQTSFPGFQSPISAKNCQLVAAGAAGKGPAANQCVAGQGNFYEYDAQRTVSQTLQTPYSPSTPTYAVKIGVRYTF